MNYSAWDSLQELMCKGQPATSANLQNLKDTIKCKRNGINNETTRKSVE